MQTEVRGISKQAKPGRPRKDAVPSTHLWQIQATVTLRPDAVEAEALRRAAYLIGTNLLDEEAWTDQAVIALYHEQTVAEKGFAFLKDPLFLAASVFVKVRSVCSKLAASCNEGMSSSRMADNWRSDVGCNSQPSRRRRKSIAPSVATGHQSEKRGEKREKRQASCGPPASRLPW